MTPDTASIAILLGSFLLLIVLRVPIAYAVGLSTVFCLLNMGMNLTTLATQLVKGIWSYSLMAVPFFITMGCLMGTGGISDKLVALANSLVGWMRGGLAMVNVVDSYFFGGISGSAAADTASLGSILIPMMVEQGYDDDFATALTITSSVEGILVPPSHNMVIYATSAGGVSVGALFMAGYIPGAILALCLMVGAYIISVRRGYPKGQPFSLKGFIKQCARSIWALAAILIVVVGVVAGVFTATESAAIAVIYSLFVSVYVYKGLNWKGVWNALSECVNTLSVVMILIATSAAFGYCLTILQVPQFAANAITSLSSNPIVLALLLNLILLILGCIMDMAPIILIATPILHRQGAVRHHDHAQLRHRPADPARGLGAVHRLGRVQGAHGARGQGHHALLPVHDRRAAADHLHPRDQPVPAQLVYAVRRNRHENDLPLVWQPG